MMRGRVCAPSLLPAFRAIEDDPDRQVVGEFLEAVWHLRGNEEDVTRAEAMPLAAVSEVPGPVNHHVDLVPGVGRLRIVTSRPQDFTRRRMSRMISRAAL
jgi:hypothetical protein